MYIILYLIQVVERVNAMHLKKYHAPENPPATHPPPSPESPRATHPPRSGSSDYGVYAIAYATALSLGQDPSTLVFSQ